jgi:hypothetical protein
MEVGVILVIFNDGWLYVTVDITLLEFVFDGDFRATGFAGGVLTISAFEVLLDMPFVRVDGIGTEADIGDCALLRATFSVGVIEVGFITDVSTKAKAGTTEPDVLFAAAAEKGAIALVRNSIAAIIGVRRIDFV